VRNALLDNDERGGLIGEGMNQDRCIQCGELSASPLIWASPGSSFPVRHRAIRGRSLAWRHLTQSAGGLGGNKKLLASWTEHNVSPGHQGQSCVFDVGKVVFKKSERVPEFALCF